MCIKYIFSLPNALLHTINLLIVSLSDSKAIVDGNLKLILGLVWTLILHYSISMPVWEDEGDDDAKKQTPKQRLLGWIQNKIPYLPITNFNQNWQDGKALGALVDSCAPGESSVSPLFPNGTNSLVSWWLCIKREYYGSFP